MEFNSTTATAAEKLKRLTKTLRKITGTLLAVALDAVAKQDGYKTHPPTKIDQQQKTPIRAVGVMVRKHKSFRGSEMVRLVEIEPTTTGITIFGVGHLQPRCGG